MIDCPRGFFIVPRGVEHKPVADVETHVLLFRAGVDAQHRKRARRTVSELERI